MKKPMLFLALEALLVAALLLPCQGSQGGSGGAKLTVTGTVFCDACSSSSFSNHSYFLPGSNVACISSLEFVLLLCVSSDFLLCSEAVSHLFVRCEGQNRLRDQSELDIQGGDQDHGREGHRQPRRLPA